MTRSVWQRAAAPPARRASQIEADVVIVGAGIAGACTAWWLRGSGRRVAVLDRTGPAAGASGRNAGFLTVGSLAHFARERERHGLEGALRLRRLVRDSLRALLDAVAEEAIECGAEQTGSVSAASTEPGLEDLAAADEALAAAGMGLQRMGAGTLQERFGLRGFFSGFFDADDGQVHPVQLVEGLLDRSGSALYAGVEIAEIMQESGEFLVSGPGFEARAGAVVLATNAFGGQLSPWLERHLEPVRGQALCLEADEDLPAGSIYATEDWAYFRRVAPRRLVIGGMRPRDVEGERGTADQLHDEIQAALEAFARNRVEGMTSARVVGRWSGPLAYTPDRVPLAGAVPDTPGLYALAGFCGHGMAWAFTAARSVAEQLQGRSGETLLSPMRLDAAKATAPPSVRAD